MFKYVMDTIQSYIEETPQLESVKTSLQSQKIITDQMHSVTELTDEIQAMTIDQALSKSYSQLNLHLTEPAQNAQELLTLPFEELSHMSETAGWIIPPSAKDTVQFTQAASSQKEYVREMNQQEGEMTDIVEPVADHDLYFARLKGKRNSANVKYNSCSTLYVDGTLSSSDLRDTIQRYSR